MDIQFRSQQKASIEAGDGRPGITNNFDQQRFVPFFYADVTEHVKFAAELEIEHGIRESSENEIETGLEFAHIDYLVNEMFNIRAGILLLPIGKFNLLHDSPLNDLTDRPLVSQLIIPSTMSETGAGFYGTFYPGRTSKMDYELYVTTGPCGYGSAGNPLVNEADGTRDGRQRTCAGHAPRNSPPLVNATLDPPDGILLHFDAEFNSIEDLVAGTFTGRNFGWLPGERAQAIAHIANVVRGDDGSFDPSGQFDGLSYRILFTGNNPAIPDEARLPPEFRAFVGSGTDQEIFDAVVKVVTAYVNRLRFSGNEDSGAPIRSPFDVFLEQNGLPQQPDPNESPIDYSRRLRTLVNAPGFNPQFVTSNPNRADGQFQFHNQPFEFGATELDGLKMFLMEPAAPVASAGELAAGKIGNCIA